MADSADDPGHAYFTPQYDTARKYAKAASHVTNYLHTPGTGTTTPYVYKVAPTGEYHDDATTDEHGNDYAPGVVQYKSRHPNAM